MFNQPGKADLLLQLALNAQSSTNRETYDSTEDWIEKSWKIAEMNYKKFEEQQEIDAKEDGGRKDALMEMLRQQENSSEEQTEEFDKSDESNNGKAKMKTLHSKKGEV